jgi:1-acyl-sn-glycerol-3-phosphate acyltransferase
MTGRDLLQMLFFALLIKPFMALFIGLRVRGKENLPKTDPFVLIANHTSHLDTISLLSLFAVTRLRRIHPVAAADYFERNKLIAFFTKTCFNILPIARKDISPGNHPLDRMEAQLRAGKSLIVFPEGTRGSSEEMGPFRSGVARLLERAPNVPVVPAYLLNMGRSLPKGEFIPVPFFCEVRLGVPRIMHGSKEEMIEALKAAVLELKEPV